MKRFIKDIILFLILGLVLGEIIARSFVLTSDIPRRSIDDSGIQKYFPNQKGKWKGGEHEWQINEMGWPGILPESQESLITIIGDSFIENFMNPDSCHQAIFLKKSILDYNFLEASRSGVSLIEAFEIAKELDTLKPKKQLIYLHESDFEESIVQLGRHNDITQLDLNEGLIINGKMKSPGLKRILYNWKFLYYLYTRFPINFNKNLIKNGINSETTKEPIDKSTNYIKLLDYIERNYKIENIILVFKPESDIEIINLTKNMGFETLLLNSENYETWSFEYDNHWTCYGHEQAAKQVADYLNKHLLDKSEIISLN